MDPTTALRELRDRFLIAKRILNGTDTTTDPEANLEEIIELFDGLDKWLSHGGFTPNQWTTNTARGGW